MLKVRIGSAGLFHLISSGSKEFMIFLIACFCCTVDNCGYSNHLNDQVVIGQEVSYVLAYHVVTSNAVCVSVCIVISMCV